MVDESAMLNEKNELLNDGDELLSCPFCGGDELHGNVWTLAEQRIDAIECVSCLASAPIVVWQNRTEKQYVCPSCDFFDIDKKSL